MPEVDLPYVEGRPTQETQQSLAPVKPQAQQIQQTEPAPDQPTAEPLGDIAARLTLSGSSGSAAIIF
jgi:hypothetical protein